jgi:hypothetical protein
MPRRRGKARSQEPEATVPADEKIARLLAMLLVRDMDTEEAALKLDGVGFGSRDITAMLGVSSNYVANAKYKKRRASKKRSARKRVAKS